MEFLYPSVKTVHWKVDVAISSSDVRRVMTPIVTLNLVLTDDTVFTYELTTEELHMLRVALAMGVKNLAYLNRRKRPAVSQRKKLSLNANK